MPTLFLYLYLCYGCTFIKCNNFHTNTFLQNYFFSIDVNPIYGGGIVESGGIIIFDFSNDVKCNLIQKTHFFCLAIHIKHNLKTVKGLKIYSQDQIFGRKKYIGLNKIN